MLLSELGKSIRAKREKQGLSQDAFTRMSGIPRRTLTRLESGDPAVRIGTFERAAQALGLGLILAESQKRRPTLDELEALYREEGDNEARVAPRAGG